MKKTTTSSRVEDTVSIRYFYPSGRSSNVYVCAHCDGFIYLESGSEAKQFPNEQSARRYLKKNYQRIRRRLREYGRGAAAWFGGTSSKVKPGGRFKLERMVVKTDIEMTVEVLDR